MNYLFTSPKLYGKMLFKYHSNGMLAGFEVEGFPTGKQLQWILKNMPYHESQLPEMRRKTKGKLLQVQEDMSFGNFWNTYNYRVGNKKRSEKLWDALGDADKAKALTSIRSYDNFLTMRPGQEKLYPETFLFQRRFENTYSK